MKSMLMAFVAMAAFLLAAPCHAATTEEYKATATEMIAVFQGLADAMESVKDEASAKVAELKMKEMGDKMATIQKKMNDLGEPTADQEKELESLKPKMDAALEKFGKEAARIAADPALAAATAEAMKALQPK